MVYLTDKIRVSSCDCYNITVEALIKSRNKKTGELEDKWNFFGNYGTLRDAIYAIYRRRAHELTSQEILVGDGDELLNKLDEIETSINTALDEIKMMLKEPNEPKIDMQSESDDELI